MLTLGTMSLPFLFRYAPISKGMLNFIMDSSVIRELEVMDTCWVEITAVMPRAKNMPAMVTMKGWMPRYPTQ